MFASDYLSTMVFHDSEKRRSDNKGNFRLILYNEEGYYKEVGAGGKFDFFLDSVCY